MNSLINIWKYIKTNKLILFIGLVLLIVSPLVYKVGGIGIEENKIISTNIEETINPSNGKIIKLEKKIEHIKPRKTLWDLLNLSGTLAIPIVLYQFQVNEKRRSEEQTESEKQNAKRQEELEKYIAKANLHEEIFQAYIDKMAEIIVDNQNRCELISDESYRTPI